MIKKGFTQLANSLILDHRLPSANFYELRLPKIDVPSLSKSTQSDYPKKGYYYKRNTITNNTINNKGKFKRLKKFDE